MQKLEIKKKEINALPISNAGGDEKLIINFMWPKEHDLIVKDRNEQYYIFDTNIYFQ